MKGTMDSGSITTFTVVILCYSSILDHVVNETHLCVCYQVKNSMLHASRSLKMMLRRPWSSHAVSSQRTLLVSDLFRYMDQWCISQKHHDYDRPILSFYNRYRLFACLCKLPDNRYAEPIFIYCYKVHKEQSEVHSSLSVVLTTTNNCWKLTFSCQIES